MFSTNILAEEIIGIPKIVDGDTVHIDNYKIHNFLNKIGYLKFKGN